MAQYAADPDVEYAEPDYEVHVLDTKPADPKYSGLWGVKRIEAPHAWDVERGSDQIVVAVIDTGIDADHPDLAANVWVNPGEIPGNNIDDDGNGFVDEYTATTSTTTTAIRTTRTDTGRTSPAPSAPSATTASASPGSTGT